MFDWLISQFMTMPIITVQAFPELKDYSTHRRHIEVDIPIVPLNYWEEDLSMQPDPLLEDHVLSELKEAMPEVIRAWTCYRSEEWTKDEIEQELHKWRKV